MSNGAWMGVSLALIGYLVYQIGSELLGNIVRWIWPPAPPIFLGQHVMAIQLWGLHDE